jgi:hypothetical protein
MMRILGFILLVIASWNMEGRFLKKMAINWMIIIGTLLIVL